jgi:hypothetical protein
MIQPAGQVKDVKCSNFVIKVFPSLDTTAKHFASLVSFVSLQRVMDTTMTEPQSLAHVDPDIFKDLQEKIDQESKVRDVRQPGSLAA